MSNKQVPSLAAELYLKAETKTDDEIRAIIKEQDKAPIPTDESYPHVKLVVGPSPFTMPRGWEYYLTSPYEGVSYIASVLHNAGYPVEIVDLRFEVNRLEKALESITDSTEILMVSTFEDNFPFVREFMAEARKKKPDLLIVCGGSLVTSVPHIFMKYTEMDVALFSEGEITVYELIETFRKRELKKKIGSINGLIYRKEDGTMGRTNPRGQTLDLDFLPKMKLDLWPQAKSPMGLQPQIISSYSRGCKFDCSFCYRTTPQVSAKSPEKLDEELTYLKKVCNLEFVFFTDLTFTANKPYTLRILEVIKQHNIRWTCMTRCASVNMEILHAMKDAGCDIILFGVESLGANALKEAHKPTTKIVSLKAMRMCLEAGIRFGGLTIVGIPGETEESLESMLEWAEEFNTITRVKYLSLMPGTKFYNDALRDGTIRTELDHLKWLSIEEALLEDEFLNVSGLPEKVIRSAYERIYNSYQPGPVMDFKHFPKNLNYSYPNKDSGAEHCIDYGGAGWRKKFSSTGPQLYTGSENYILDKTNSAKVAEAGSSLMACGAKKLGQQDGN